MRHVEKHQDLSEAVLVAAEIAVDRSAEMLQIILRNPAVKWKADQTLSENIENCQRSVPEWRAGCL